MPPAVFISDGRDHVVSAFASKPKFTDPQTIALYNWCLRLLTALFNYVTYFLGDSSDRNRIDSRGDIQGLEEQPAVLPPRPPTTQQPSLSSQSSPRARCKRCSALGHDTENCRTKDPIAVKKRVSNNQKLRKPSLRGLQFPRVPPQYSTFYGPTDRFCDPLLFSHSSRQSGQALAADAKELRRRKMLSARDRRRRGAITISPT